MTRNEFVDYVVRKLKRAISETEQIIRDGDYFNGLGKGPPLDLEQHRVDLHKLKQCLAKFISDNPKD